MALPVTMSPGAADLGLGADLQQQVKDETDEEKKRRLLEQRTAQLSPGAAALGLTGGRY